MNKFLNISQIIYFRGGRRCRDRMVVGFATTDAISAYQY